MQNRVCNKMFLRFRRSIRFRRLHGRRMNGIDILRRINTRDSSSLRVKTRRKGRFPLLSCCQAHYTGELSLSGSS